jgi:hypothetical protein
MPVLGEHGGQGIQEYSVIVTEHNSRHGLHLAISASACEAAGWFRPESTIRHTAVSRVRALRRLRHVGGAFTAQRLIFRQRWLN